MERCPHKLTVGEIEQHLGREPRLLIEIGANDGDDTLLFLKHFDDCHIVAFEPDPRAAEKFKTRVKSARCQLVEKAVSDEDGTTTLYMSAGAEGFWDREWDKSSSICQPTRHLIRSPEITFPDDEKHRVEVPTVTLDTWWGTFPRKYAEIDFIWCDPQGAQAKIIEGGRKALASTRWLYIEYYDIPLYSGEPTLGEIQMILPGWELVAVYENENALFTNLSL